ncbi:hypothetical protein SHM7688_02005 [Shimia marina]|uniref:Uncharacterized protein n=1 Tax=Shimia marina TaxID=321267 RepID=A0A0P1EQ67_9RHOB|nr:hypothetical protein SHM7688_02005 [Shimia marina]
MQENVGFDVLRRGGGKERVLQKGRQVLLQPFGRVGASGGEDWRCPKLRPREDVVLEAELWRQEIGDGGGRGGA